MLRLGKSWQGQTEIVFQVSATKYDFKKCYLIIEYSQNKPNLYLTINKPENLQPSGLTAILRRQISNAALLEIQTSQENVFCLKLYHQDANTYLRFDANSKPPEISFIKNNESLLRFSTKGLYTKRKPAPLEEVSDNTDLIPELISKLKTPQPKSTNLKTTRTKAQSQACRKLGRRKKTVFKALIKLKGQIPSENGVSQKLAQAKALEEKIYNPPQELLLDHKISPGENLNQLYKQYKKAKKARDIGLKQLLRYQKETEILANDYLLLKEEVVSDAEIAKILNRHKIATQTKENSKKDQHSPNYISFYYQETFFYLGRTAKQNDDLTKHARADDYWFHAQGVRGAHVIIPKRKLPQINPEIKRTAAILAIHHSKLHLDQKGEVYFTQRRYLRKTAGLPPGKWQIDRSETMYVNYSDAEIAEILKSKKTN